MWARRRGPPASPRVRLHAPPLLLMAPPVYHRLRWGWGGKTDVIVVAGRLFLVGRVSWLSGVLAAVYLVTSVLYDSTVAIVTTCAIGVAVLLIWYLLPLRRGSRPDVRARE